MWDFFVRDFFLYEILCKKKSLWDFGGRKDILNFRILYKIYIFVRDFTHVWDFCERFLSVWDFFLSVFFLLCEISLGDFFFLCNFSPVWNFCEILTLCEIFLSFYERFFYKYSANKYTCMYIKKIHIGLIFSPWFITKKHTLVFVWVGLLEIETRFWSFKQKFISL